MEGTGPIDDNLVPNLKGEHIEKLTQDGRIKDVDPNKLNQDEIKKLSTDSAADLAAPYQGEKFKVVWPKVKAGRSDSDINMIGKKFTYDPNVRPEDKQALINDINDFEIIGCSDVAQCTIDEDGRVWVGDTEIKNCPNCNIKTNDNGQVIVEKPDVKEGENPRIVVQPGGTVEYVPGIGVHQFDEDGQIISGGMDAQIEGAQGLQWGESIYAPYVDSYEVTNPNEYEFDQINYLNHNSQTQLSEAQGVRYNGTLHADSAQEASIHSRTSSVH
ncbi:MAG: hypothetical protein ACQESG_07845 [Nanobdellota archaeon]